MSYKNFSLVFRVTALLALLLAAFQSNSRAQGTTELISVNRTNTGSGDKGSFSQAITPNGRFVVFASDAGNLTDNTVSGLDDIFVRDRWSGTSRLVSFNEAGIFGGNGSSQVPLITPTGRYVVFQSSASNLVSNDTNGPNNPDVFVRDLQTSTTILVSVNAAGTASGNKGSFHPMISDDGRYVAFYSQASDLVANDSNLLADIFVRDLQTNKTVMISVNSAGTGGGDGDSFVVAMTPDGRNVVFGSYARNLTTLSDTNNNLDLFVRDTLLNSTQLITVNQSGAAAGNAGSGTAVITPDGHFLAFESSANDLTSNDTNQSTDLFVRNLRAGSTVLVSVNNAGTASGNATSIGPSISSDGRYVAFASQANNLVVNDNNGFNGDVFVRDLRTATTQLVTVNRTNTGSGTGDSFFAPVISAEGRYVAFLSRATNLVAFDTPGQNAFVRDLVAQSTKLVSVNTSGAAGANGGVFSPLITPGGQYVAYLSLATNLANNDFNNAEDVFVFTTNPSTTPIDDVRFFVRQQYLDFLNREPDQNGWDYWTSQITQCGGDLLCIHNQRIGISAAFFIELEFQQTGFVIHRIYRVAFGTLPNAPTRANITFNQFIADRGRLIGGSGLAQSTIDFANEFVQRPTFKASYPDSMPNAEFVGKLFDTAGIFTDPGPDPRRQQLTDDLNAGRKTRAEVLLAIIDFSDFKNREYKPSFVLMQYFGYLRRNPDQAGYDFWLNVLNSDPNNFRGMVCSFLTSTEYQQRFSSVVTRSNNDCPSGPQPTPSPSPTPSVSPSPSPSPANGKIGYLGSGGTGGFFTELYTMNADGSQQTRLTLDNQQNSNVEGFDWSPDGTRIIFEIIQFGLHRLVLINADGSGRHEVAAATVDNRNPQWAPDGLRVVFERPDGIYVTDFSDEGTKKLTSGQDQFPDWTPDGTHISFRRTLGSVDAIFVMNDNGSQQTNISNSQSSDFEPNWSPNGSKIVLSRQAAGHFGYDLVVMNSDGSDQINITNMPDVHNVHPRWSGDGSKILFQSTRDGYAQIYLTNPQGTSVTRLTNNSAQDTAPEWSPDGAKITFGSDRVSVTISFDIYVMNVDGSNQVRLTMNGYAIAPLWQPRH